MNTGAAGAMPRQQTQTRVRNARIHVPDFVLAYNNKEIIAASQSIGC